MKKLAALFLGLAAVVPAGARAQVSVRFSIPLPATPPLVYVQPDVQVVEDYDEEVFFHDDFYWVRRDGRWFRSHRPRSEFVFVEPRYIPAPLGGLEVGRYRRYRHHVGMAERERLRREEFRREEFRRNEYRHLHEAEYRDRERRRAEELRRFEGERRHEEALRRAEREHHRAEAVRREPERRREGERHEVRHEVRREEARRDEGQRQHQAVPATNPRQQHNAPNGKHHDRDQNH